MARQNPQNFYMVGNIFLYEFIYLKLPKVSEFAADEWIKVCQEVQQAQNDKQVHQDWQARQMQHVMEKLIER